LFFILFSRTLPPSHNTSQSKASSLFAEAGERTSDIFVSQIIISHSSTEPQHLPAQGARLQSKNLLKFAKKGREML